MQSISDDKFLAGKAFKAHQQLDAALSITANNCK